MMMMMMMITATMMMVVVWNVAAAVAPDDDDDDDDEEEEEEEEDDHAYFEGVVDSPHVPSRDEWRHWWRFVLVPWPFQNVGAALCLLEVDVEHNHNVVDPRQSRHKMLHVPFVDNESIARHFVVKRHPSGWSLSLSLSSSWDPRRRRWGRMSFFWPCYCWSCGTLALFASSSIQRQ
jgi:hypothetical protein